MSHSTPFDNICWAELDEMSDEEYNAMFYKHMNVPFVSSAPAAPPVSSSVFDDEWIEVSKKTKAKKEKELIDKLLICKKCSNHFEFRVHQQIKYKNNDWQEPKICWACQKDRANARAKVWKLKKIKKIKKKSLKP